MVFGLTVKTQSDFGRRIAEKLNLNEEAVMKAIDDINREEVARIAKNDITDKG